MRVIGVYGEVDFARELLICTNRAEGFSAENVLLAANFDPRDSCAYCRRRKRQTQGQRNEPKDAAFQNAKTVYIHGLSSTLDVRQQF
jgi:hypothetical protein